MTLFLAIRTGFEAVETVAVLDDDATLPGPPPPSLMYITLALKFMALLFFCAEVEAVLLILGNTGKLLIMYFSSTAGN